MNKPIILNQVGKINNIYYGVLEVEGGKAYYGGPYTVSNSGITLSKNPKYYNFDKEIVEPLAIKSYQRGEKL